MRFPLALILAAGLFIGCGGTPNPAAPSTSFGATGSSGQFDLSSSRNSIQRVDEGGGGGGEVCLDPELRCPGFVEITAGDAHLSGGTTISRTSNPFVFTATARSDGLFPFSGHFSGGTIRITVSDGAAATVSLSLVSSNNGATFDATGTALAVQITDGYCDPSLHVGSVATTITLELRYFGKTRIFESHDVRCTP
jgi:hypothetical protein